MIKGFRYFPAWGRSFEDLAAVINQLIKDGNSVLHIGGPVYNPDNGEWCQALWVWQPPEESDEAPGTFAVKMREFIVPDEPGEWDLPDMMQG